MLAGSVERAHSGRPFKNKASNKRSLSVVTDDPSVGRQLKNRLKSAQTTDTTLARGETKTNVVSARYVCVGLYRRWKHLTN